MNIDNGVTWADQIEQLEADASAPSTAIASRPPAQEGILWSVSESIIATAKKETALLKINGVTDLVGYEAVKKAKWKFTKFRTGVEAVKKKMNEEAQRQIKKNGADAKLLLDLIEPEEDRLQGMLRDIDVAIAEAKQAAEDELFDLRRSKLVEAAGAYPHFVMLSESAMRHMTETEFDSELNMVRSRAENQAIIDEQAEKQRAETERENARVAAENKKAAAKLAEERAEMERESAIHRAAFAKQQEALAAQRAEQAEAQRKLDAETQRMVSERRAKEEAERLEIARKAAAEQARIDTEQRIAREAAELARAVEIDAANKARAESLRPDREKLAQYADDLLAMRVPEVSGPAHSAAKECRVAVEMAADQIRRIAVKVT